MGKRNTAADFYLIDLRRTEIRVWPLYGLNRLIKLDHRNRSGVLYCDNVMGISESFTFSEANERKVPYTIYHGLGLHGALSEPRLNVPNEATPEELQRFRDDGAEIVISFTPQKGKTFSTEFEIYKSFDAGYRKGQLDVDDDRRIAKWELTLDVSAYLAAGHPVSDIRCEYESAAESNRAQKATLGRTRRLAAIEKGTGLWGWKISNLSGGTIRITWGLGRRDEAQLPKTANLEKLATELSIDVHLAKDLHNFVLICHYFVAGFRSLNKIAPEMMTNKSVVNRSIESIEKLIGAEVIQRTHGKGLVQVTPAGEAVLDWWSQFYMRWTPISP